MFAEQRMEIIKQILREQKHVNIATLSSTLKVSDVTVRKYLDILEKQGVLEKVHGGAIWGPEGHECEPFSEPDEDENLDAIAALAATLVEEGDSLYVGPGLTCTAFAHKIADKANISVMTNNFRAMNYLAGKVNNLNFIGGDVTVLPGGSAYTYGSKTALFLENMAICKAFVGCDGLDVDAGVTAQSLPFTETVRQIMSISRSLYTLGLSRKFGKVAMYRICPMDALHAIITDAGVEDIYKQYCYEQGIKLLTAYKHL